MARIAIVKVRSPHDVEWQLPRGLGTALGLLGLGELRRRLLATQGLAFMPQLTLPYLAAIGHRYNEQQGTSHRFVLLDDHAERIDLSGFEMAWFTGVTPTMPEVYRLSDQARRRGITTVIGGIHATMMPGEAAAHADAVAIGEGEVTVPQILADFDAGELAPSYRGRNIESLAGLPQPRWQDSRFADYCPWIVPVQTSRGCRNACRFCSTTRYQGARRRHRPVAEIVGEIRELQASGVLTPEKVIFFTDNNIVSDSDHRRGVRDTRYARSLFEALIPLDVLWTGQGEIGVAEDLETVELLARSGCIELLVGLESIAPDNLAAVGKPCNQVETYERHIATLHDHGIALIGCFIFGLDHDGPDVFRRTVRFIERQIDVPQLSLMTPFPGTGLHRRLLRQQRVLHHDWSQYDITHTVFRPRGLSPEQLDEGYRWISERVYRFPAMLQRALRHAARRTRFHHPRMPFASRFSSVLAPNIVYRNLSLVGRRTRHRPLRAHLNPWPAWTG